jgi:uncharacterized membrane protein YkvA (DUF1232 family)
MRASGRPRVAAKNHDAYRRRSPIDETRTSAETRDSRLLGPVRLRDGCHEDVLMLRERLQSHFARLKREFRVYQLLLQDSRTPKLAKWLLGFAVAYLLMPFDIIPDFIPVLGQLDDLIIVPPPDSLGSEVDSKRGHSRLPTTRS